MAFPLKAALMVAGNLSVTSPLPFTDTAAPVFVQSESAIYKFLAVPQFAVVILPVPSNEVPLIVRAVANLVAAAAVAVLARYPLATSAVLAYGVRSILVVPIFSNLELPGIQIYSSYTSFPDPSLALTR